MKRLLVTKNRCVVLSLLGLILLAQTALVVHSVEHSALPHHSHCVLCSASHAAGPGASLPSFEPLKLLFEQPLSTEPAMVYLQLVTHYASRAPPILHALS